jgi:transposase
MWNQRVAFAARIGLSGSADFETRNLRAARREARTMALAIDPTEGVMTEFYLTDERWALIATRVPGKDGDPGCHGRDNRLFIEAVLWIARTGARWRDLPAQFGKWYTAYTRFRRWTKKGVWPGVFSDLAQDSECEYFFQDGRLNYAPLRALLARELEAGPLAAQDEEHRAA